MKIFISITVVLLLAGCRTGYEVRGDRVIWVSWNEGPGREEKPVPEASPINLVTFDFARYAKDRNTAFYRGSAIPGVDVESFRPIGEMYAVDSNRVYFGDSRIGGADPDTFSIVDGVWSRDASDYYNGVNALDVCDYNTFHLSDIWIDRWALDDQCAYYMSEKLPLRDRESLELYPGGYAKDNQAAYYLQNVIPEADPATFRVINRFREYMGKDGNACYDGREQIECPRWAVNR